ncbi:TPA: glycosyltransferase family 2 protein [Streptococcus suis]|uniref:glycosyltransferase family 2 protein n=1 Tax=Streptococcus suis TaxID=1307 RepID=UPI000CF5A3EB|nr:glycosyltransferase family 2 protein [Streptococcus suis]MCK4068538.1 glycosyltransferase family 2 protein [Streptococcus suis]HEM6556612.1 glycosyltransferase family 2 protein [Streptococcus suis]HEM6589683.1 glycosyltransferase family 2 protein [Streptococcus suis]
MFFTVCIPTFNRSKTLIRTLESLRKQTFKDFEILVIDDGSEDDTESVVKNWSGEQSCRYFYKENGGKHSAINVGLDNAKGTFFLILDSDDWLIDEGLRILYNYAKDIVDDNQYCGVLARAFDSNRREMIGELIPDEYLSMSYIDFHFGIGRKKSFLDCCECNKTVILQQYRFPIAENMKFVPEAWLFDQVGLNYSLICTNEIVRMTEYLENGMTADVKFKDKQYLGFLHHYVSRIEVIIPEAKLNFPMQIVAWWRYWDCVRKDSAKNGVRVKKVTLLGRIVYLLNPVIDIAYKIMYRKLAKRGR